MDPAIKENLPHTPSQLSILLILILQLIGVIKGGQSSEDTTAYVRADVHEEQHNHLEHLITASEERIIAELQKEK